jgi:predicted amidohydrolase YtcJ
MSSSLRIFLRVLWVLPLLFLGGCCCCNLGALRNAGGTGGTAAPPADPAEAEDLATATEYAQKALNAKGYGVVQTAALRKDDIYWYVEGAAEGKEGGTVNYMVMFQVNRFDNRQTWSVQTVSIDGEVVYP